MNSVSGLLLIAALTAPRMVAAQPVVFAMSPIEAKIAAQMRDPESVQFRGVHFARRAKPGQVSVVCGEINARNGFGGYVGFMPFAADISYNFKTLAFVSLWLPPTLSVPSIAEHCLPSLSAHERLIEERAAQEARQYFEFRSHGGQPHSQ